MKGVILCDICANKLRPAYELKKVGEMSMDKIRCANCGKPRFGATYEVTKKERNKNPAC